MIFSSTHPEEYVYHEGDKTLANNHGVLRHIVRRSEGPITSYQNWNNGLFHLSPLVLGNGMRLHWTYEPRTIGLRCALQKLPRSPAACFAHVSSVRVGPKSSLTMALLL